MEPTVARVMAGVLGGRRKPSVLQFYNVKGGRGMTGKSLEGTRGNSPGALSRRSFLGWLGILAVTPHIALEPRPSRISGFATHLPPGKIARTVQVYQSDFGIITVQTDCWSNHGVGSTTRNGLPWSRQDNHVPPGHPPR